MRFSVLICAAMACTVPGLAIASDASDCEDDAHKLRRLASDVEDAASTWSSAISSGDASQIRSAEQSAQSAAEDAYGRAGRMLRNCTSSVQRGQPLSVVSASVRAYLLARFGETQEVRKRLVELDPSLRGIAQLHVNVRPADFRMTYAVAEALFSDGWRGHSAGGRR